jgi:hypothetical protein
LVVPVVAPFVVPEDIDVENFVGVLVVVICVCGATVRPIAVAILLNPTGRNRDGRQAMTAK